MRDSEASRLLGKNVEVVIDHDKPELVRGMLLSYNDTGEAVVIDEEGCIHYCWPRLEIREVK